MSKCLMCDVELTWIKDYEGEYIISSSGEVFCAIDNKRQLKQTPSYKIVQKDKNGYLRVSLYKNRKAQSKQIHRLVAEAFIENEENKPCINHKNGNKEDNSVNNLEWVTYSENIQHAYDNELRNDRYEVIQYDLSGNEINKFKSELEAFKKTKIKHINEVTKGKRKQAGGYLWRRVNNVI